MTLPPRFEINACLFDKASHYIDINIASILYVDFMLYMCVPMSIYMTDWINRLNSSPSLHPCLCHVTL